MHRMIANKSTILSSSNTSFVHSLVDITVSGAQCSSGVGAATVQPQRERCELFLKIERWVLLTQLIISY